MCLFSGTGHQIQISQSSSVYRSSTVVLLKSFSLVHVCVCVCVCVQMVSGVAALGEVTSPMSDGWGWPQGQGQFGLTCVCVYVCVCV